MKKIKSVLFVVGIMVLVGVGYIVTDSFAQPHREVADLKGNPLSFDEYADFFENLAEEKGGAYAFQALLQADIAPGTDLHLLGHVVGDILYKQKGIDGIYDCTPDFRNACSHSIVVGLFSEEGKGALNEIAEACSNAPGGSGAYTMCFHGLGHGILAYANYNFEQAIEMCAQTGSEARQNREYVECVGGATMEMFAGVHDRNAWELEKDNYFKEDDPLAPCNASFMPELVRPICYTYLTPHLFVSAGADLARPQPEDYEKAFTYCDEIPKKNRAEWEACYGGFGKEFLVLAQDRDIRDIGSAPKESLQRIREWCALTDNEAGRMACNASALGSLFWGGENNPDASFTFCAIAEDERERNACYRHLSETIVYFMRNTKSAAPLCNRLPEGPHRNFCLNNT
ncbi:MAG: hypothetical protein ACJKTH_03860 [Patescibacteria group bacterium UBA2163]